MKAFEFGIEYRKDLHVLILIRRQLRETICEDSLRVKINIQSSGGKIALNRRRIFSFTVSGKGKENNMDANEFIGCAAKRIIYSRNCMLQFGAGSDEYQGHDFETKGKTRNSHCGELRRTVQKDFSDILEESVEIEDNTVKCESYEHG